MNQAVGLFQVVLDKVMDYGLGDVQYWGFLEGLRLGGRPLIAGPALPSYDGQGAARGWQQGTFNLTVLGSEVLDNKIDAIGVRGINRWLGGVHLERNRNIWRWDGSKQQLQKH